MLRVHSAVLLLALLPCALCKGVAPALASKLKAQGDAAVVSVACCGSGCAKRSVLREALGAPATEVAVVDAPTPLVLAAAGEVGEGAAVLSASDVVALEVRFSDLVGRSAHGLSQLAPVLHRAMRLRHIRPQKKLLLLAVTEFDRSEASEAEVEAFVAAELEAMGSEVAPDGTPLSSVLQLKVAFVPYRQHQAAEYAASVASLGEALTLPGAGYLFADGAWAAPASAVASSLDQLLAAEPMAPKQAAPPAEVHAAFRCGVLAEAAAREFNKGAAVLRKQADSALLADFGEQAGALLSAALARFDADSAAYEGSSPVSAARGALQMQLSRSMYGPFRKQLAALQRKTLAVFRQKLQALKPSSEIDAQLAALQKEVVEGFDAQAAALLPPGVKWGYSYEKQAVADNVAENAALHLHTLQVQGLYLPTEGVKLPLDISAHWLGLHPFGRDSRYDPVGVDDAPAFRPQAAPMSMRASTGYRPRTKLTDPKKMVFTDKMIQ